MTPQLDGLYSFGFELQVTSYGPHTLEITAEDISGNKTIPVMRQFELVSQYKPKTVEDLLAPRSYLDALLRFINSHILDATGKPIDPTILRDSFGLDFGKISEPGSQVGSRRVSDLLLPAALLRKSMPGMWTKTPSMPTPNTGLICRFTLERSKDDSPSEFADKGPYRFGAGVLKDGAKFSDLATDIGGAAEFDGTGYAMFGHRPAPGMIDKRAALAVGDNDRDFSVSFWIYVRNASGPGGQWRGVLYKGHEDATFTDVNRTFGIWLHPDSNIIHYRISTDTDSNAGGDSKSQVAVDRWTHIAYVRRGSRLQLFLDGQFDSEAVLTGTVLSNSDDLIIGKSPYHAGINGALNDLRIYGLALTPDDVAALARSRSAPATSEAPLDAYVRTAYEALLIGAGTSHEEMRTLPPRGSTDRLRIAERLSLLKPSRTDDDLDVLLLPTLRSSEQNEEWLFNIFDLPSTKSSLPAIRSWRGWLLQMRQENLASRWMLEESSVPLQERRPLLEPDLVELDDLLPSHKSAAGMLELRTRR